MISLALFGAEGRMGRLIREEAAADIRVIQGIDQGDEPVLDPEAEVIVDFSTASAWGSLDSLLSGTGVPLVSGTTGLGEAQKELLAKWSLERPVFYASNMSLGVFVLERLMRLADSYFDRSFDRELIEFHHARKLDSPSGTALHLLKNWPGEPSVHSIRGGDIAGEHHLHYMGPGERLVISHMASDRRVFVMGALRAVRFIHGVTAPGLYGMEDMLG